MLVVFRFHRSASRAASVLGLVTALSMGGATPAVAAEPLWVTDPFEYWHPSRDCTHMLDSDAKPGSGQFMFFCSSSGDTLTAWAKGKAYPLKWGRGPGNASFSRHEAPYDCIAPGTPVYVEGTITHVEWVDGPTEEDYNIPWRPVYSKIPYSGWDGYEIVQRQPVPARCGNPSVFTDIGPGHSQYAAVQWAATHAITSGWKDGTYRPNTTVTRETMAAFLARWGNVPIEEKLTGGLSTNITSDRWRPDIRPTYRDVPPARPFSVEISLLSQIGVIKGWPDGTFRPAQKVTREQTAAFLYRLAGSPAYTPPKTSRFKDVKPGATFYKEISWMAKSGFTTGYSDGTYRPSAPITRGEVAVMLHRFDKVYTGANRYNGVVK